MHEPMRLEITLAVGGNWTGPADETTTWPGERAIDRVRPFRFDDLAAQSAPDPDPEPAGAAAP